MKGVFFTARFEITEILLSKVSVLVLSLFRSLVFWSCEFVSNFGFRLPRRSGAAKAGASDLGPAARRPASLGACFIFFLLNFTPPVGASDFRSVTGPCDFVFPRDHGAHPDFRTEWWYYTGNVGTPSGKRYGFQLTFFRTQIAEPGSEKTWPKNPSAWRTKDIFLAHTALSDLEKKRFHLDERVARSGAGLAGVTQDQEDTRVFIGNWSALIQFDHHRLNASANEFSLDLLCKAAKPLAAHGQEGYSIKGKRRESASCYYSATRLEAEGSITLRGTAVPLRGTAWMDHEFSSAPLEDDLEGWDWFSLQLEDRTELMIYLLRPKAGGNSASSSGTFVKASGEAIRLSNSDFQVEVLERWKSPRSGATYPARWRIRVTPLNLELSIVPALPDQELITEKSTRVTYWEGSVMVSGRSGQNPVSGVGYVEMTGYAKPFNLAPTP
jgi:predicted secreted hydrolase